jgi:hypothetical protein
MQSYAAKLIDLIEIKSENIARLWAADVMTHDRTLSYHFLPKDMVTGQGADFYKLFRRMSIAEKPYEEAKTFSWKYAQKFYKENIPLHEAIYALMLLRRNLWLYAEFQGTFFTALEKQQAVESLNRTILLFDYISYQVTEKYEELIYRDLDKRLFAVETLMKKGCIGGANSLFQYGLMALLILVAFIITYFYHSILQTEVAFTHLFYIPIVLASICWGRKGILVALILGLMLLASHATFLKGVPFREDVVRAAMFMVVGGLVGWLMEDIKNVKELFNNFKA